MLFAGQSADVEQTDNKAIGWQYSVKWGALITRILKAEYPSPKKANPLNYSTIVGLYKPQTVKGYPLSY